MSLVGVLGCDGGRDAAPRQTPAEVVVGNGFTRFRGGVGGTPWVDFGGTPYCRYRVTMRDVVVDLLARRPIDGPADIVDLRVTSEMAEGLAEPCEGIVPAAPQPHGYTHRRGDVVTRADDGALELRPAGHARNGPPARLAVRLRPAAEGVVTALRWHRTDQAPPLDWDVVAELTLTPASCRPDAALCVGTWLLRCEADGVAMHGIVRCPSGCVASGDTCL